MTGNVRGNGRYGGHLFSFLTFLAHIHHTTTGNCTQCHPGVDLLSIKMIRKDLPFEVSVAYQSHVKLFAAADNLKYAVPYES